MQASSSLNGTWSWTAMSGHEVKDLSKDVSGGFESSEEFARYIFEKWPSTESPRSPLDPGVFVASRAGEPRNLFVACAPGLSPGDGPFGVGVGVVCELSPADSGGVTYTADVHLNLKGVRVREGAVNAYHKAVMASVAKEMSGYVPPAEVTDDMILAAVRVAGSIESLIQESDGGGLALANRVLSALSLELPKERTSVDLMPTMDSQKSLAGKVSDSLGASVRAKAKLGSQLAGLGPDDALGTKS